MQRTKFKSKRRAISIFTLMLITALISKAKDNKGEILNVDGESVSTEEFLYLYNKNNSQQTTPQSLDDYLQLFEIYRLKVAEAKSEGVDTTTTFKKEMQQYKRELLEPYLTDTIFINNLVEIAAQRDKEDVESSHIMIIRTHKPEIDNKNLQLLDSLRKELLNGADFITMAKKFSQDKFSSDKGGYLGFNHAGTFPYGFETAVYETPEGELSEIVESHVGWHIVKSGARRPADRSKYPEKSWAELKDDVLRKSASPFDSRYYMIKENKLNSLKAKHPGLVSTLQNLSQDESYDRLLVAEEELQYSENPDYRNLVDEYCNGSLLYEVSVKNIWDKGTTDEEGLIKYFNENRNKYEWEIPHAKGILIQALNDSVSNVIKQQIETLPEDSVVKYIKKNFRREAKAEKFNIAKGNNLVIDNLMFGATNELPEDMSYPVYFIIYGKILEQPEQIDDVKGIVVTDYQEQLEKEWVDSLRDKHKVEINYKEFDRIKKKLKK